MAAARKPLTTLLLLMALSGLIYLIVFTLPFPLTTYFAVTPPLDYAKLTGHSISGLIAYLAGILTLFAIYGWLLKWPGLSALPVITPYSGLLFAAILFFGYPTLAIDLLIYAVRARIWGLYGLNPLAIRPDSLPPGDPWATLAAEWGDIASPYGPLWEVISLGAFWLADGSFLGQLFFLKGLSILAYLGCIFVIGRILTEIQPEWKLAGMLAFAWNPLVLFETAQNAHNDILMVLLLLLAAWILVRAKTSAAALPVLPLVGLAVQIKVVALLAAPFFILNLTMKEAAGPRRISLFLLHSLLFAVFAVLPVAPLWPGWENWAVVSFNAGAGRSPLALLILTLRPLLGVNLAFDMSRLLINGLFAGLMLWLLWQRRRTLNRFQTTFYLSWAIFFWYVLIAVPVFHAWYLLWSLPFAILLLPDARPLAATIIFTLTALLVIPYFETIRVWFPLLLQNHLLGHLIAIPLLVGPPVWIAISGQRSVVSGQQSAEK
jgi:hypothetical protein